MSSSSNKEYLHKYNHDLYNQSLDRKNLNDFELRARRLKIYKYWIPSYSIFVEGLDGILLTPEPDERMKGINLMLAMEYHAPPEFDIDGFPGLDPRDRADSFNDMIKNPSQCYGRYEDLKSKVRHNPLFKIFTEFAFTDYGSSVIKELVKYNKIYKDDKYQKFVIREHLPKSSAEANYTKILLPGNFPSKPVFPTSGQLIHALAIIYHEFAHTMLFNQYDKEITAKDELYAVRRFENPVRLRAGLEPRYSYVHSSGKYTINIITREKKLGVWDFNKLNPCELVDANNSIALEK